MTGVDPVAAYKRELREIVNRRPSGIRRRLANAFDTHPSFVSQVTNPRLRIPLPSHHLPALFRVCHFTTDETERFLQLYERAHPGASAKLQNQEQNIKNEVRISLAAIANPEARIEAESMIRNFATQIIAFSNQISSGEKENSP